MKTKNQTMTNQTMTTHVFLNPSTTPLGKKPLSKYPPPPPPTYFYVGSGKIFRQNRLGNPSPTVWRAQEQSRNRQHRLAAKLLKVFPKTRERSMARQRSGPRPSCCLVRPAPTFNGKNSSRRSHVVRAVARIHPEGAEKWIILIHEKTDRRRLKRCHEGGFRNKGDDVATPPPASTTSGTQT